MKKAKALWAVLLSVSVIFLSGCSNILSVLRQNNSDFYEITPLASETLQYTSVDIQNENILFLSFNETDALELMLYNAEKNKITARKSLSDCPLKNIVNAKFNGENEIIVYDSEAQKGITYNLNLDEINEVDYTEENYYETEPVTELIDDRYDRRENLSLYCGTNKKVCIFNDEPDYFYMDNSVTESILSDCGKMLLSCNYIEETNNNKISVKDYANNVCINEIETEKLQENFFSNIPIGKISNDYVCFIYEVVNGTTGGVKQTPYLWKYTSNPKNTPLDIKKVTEADLNNENSNIIKELKSKYGINLLINETVPHSGYSIEYNANALDINLLLYEFEQCTELFPDNFIRELYEGISDGIDIYITGCINEVTAYTFDTVIIFQTRVFNKSTVFHEFMHLIGNRISDYYANQGEDMYELWNQFNSEGFLYGEDYNDLDDAHFVSFYAMTNENEDMAETFQYLYETAENEEFPDFLNNEQIYNKAKFICESIRKVFPSADTENKNYWEKYIELNK